MSLPGPSRTITVEPAEVPETAPQPTEPEPSEEPTPEPSAPDVEPEEVPA
jgi:hypothetical protein